MISKKHLTVALALLLVAGGLLGCAHRNRVLYDPGPIQITQSGPSKGSNTKVAQSIKQALGEYGWIIESDTPSRIVARQSRSQHVARVEILYTPKEVDVKYLSSDNLNYHVDEGVQKIHGRYNTWVQNLERRISVLVQQ